MQGAWSNRLLAEAAFPAAGAWGYASLLLMNRANRGMSRWLIRRVMGLDGGREDVLDVGCGGGRHMARLVQRTWGRVCGVDPSGAAVRMSRWVNRYGISLGREVVEQGGAEALPFADEQFDIVTAVESVYFWPSLPLGLLEVWRVLRPGGKLYICNSATERQGVSHVYEDLFVPIYTPLQMEDQLQEVGFDVVERHRHPRDGQLVCVEAQKKRPLQKDELWR